MFLVRVLGVLSFLGVLMADYDCLCSYNVEKPVQSTATTSSQIIGYMYEFDCKPVIHKPPKDAKWVPIAFEKQIGYIAKDQQTEIVICPGDPSIIDTLTTEPPKTAVQVNSTVPALKSNSPGHSSTLHTSTTLKSLPTSVLLTKTASAVPTTVGSIIISSSLPTLSTRISSTSDTSQSASFLSSSISKRSTKIPSISTTTHSITVPTTLTTTQSTTTQSTSTSPQTTISSTSTTTRTTTIPSTSTTTKTTTMPSTSTSTTTQTTNIPSISTTTRTTTIPTTSTTTKTTTIPPTTTTLKYTTPLPPSTTVAPTCPLGWKKHSNSCYLFKTDNRLTWMEASALCNRHNSHLVYIESEAENNYLVNQLKRRIHTHHHDEVETSTWLGGSDDITEGIWLWYGADKRISGYTNWYHNEPDSGDGEKEEDCMCIVGKKDWKWQDRSCRLEMYLVCEKPLGYNGGFQLIG